MGLSSRPFALVLPPSPRLYTSANLHKYARPNPFVQTHLRRFLRKAGDRLAPFAPTTILDAGCGEGFTLAALARRFPHARLTGLDANADAVAYATAHAGHAATFTTGSVYALPFEDGAFDAVICSEVLEHLDAPDRALEEVLRVARRVAFVTVPREPFFGRLLAAGVALGFSPDAEHVNFWTAASWPAFVRVHAPAARIETHSLYRLATIPRP